MQVYLAYTNDVLESECVWKEFWLESWPLAHLGLLNPSSTWLTLECKLTNVRFCSKGYHRMLILQLHCKCQAFHTGTAHVFANILNISLSVLLWWIVIWLYHALPVFDCLRQTSDSRDATPNAATSSVKPTSLSCSDSSGRSCGNNELASSVVDSICIWFIVAI